jgi:hypothetical protein
MESSKIRVEEISRYSEKTLVFRLLAAKQSSLKMG